MSRSRQTILGRMGLGLGMLLAGLIVVLAPPARALVTVGELDTPDVAIDIELVDGVAYIADYATASTNQGSSLRIVDVSDPENPVELGSSDTPVAPRALQVAGNLVFVADGDAGLRVLDASDPAAPSELSHLALPGIAYGVELVGDLAYVSSGPVTGGTEGGLHVVDVSDPAQPALLGSLALPDELARDAEAVGGLVYVVTSSTTQVAGSLHVISVGDPAQPATVSTLALPYRASDVAVSDGLAYVANGTAGLTLVDVSNPAAPSIRGGLETHGYSRGVSLAGGLVLLTDVGLGSEYTTAHQAAIRVIDVSDPANPLEVGGLAMSETLAPDFLDGAFQVEIESGHAYVANGRAGLRIVDLADPTFPAPVAWMDIRYGRQTQFSNGRAYTVDASNGVHIFDAKDPAAPRYLSTFLAEGWFAGRVVAENQFAYVAAGQYSSYGEPLWQGIRIANVANGSSPTEVGSLALERRPSDLDLSADLLLVADSTSGLRLVDVSDPAAPVEVGQLAIPGGASCVKSHGATALIAAGSGGLKLVDVSEPAAPVEIASVAGQVDRVALDATRALALVAPKYDPAGVRVRAIDVSDPAHPSEIGAWDSPGTGVQDLALAGGLAHVVTNVGTVSVVDMTDPAAPRELGSPLVSDFWYSHGWETVAVKDGILWVGTNSQGLYVIDLGPDYASFGDFDEDGLRGREDNCSELANASQLDTNLDGFGNACDADYDDDGVVGTLDFATLRRAFGRTTASPGWNPDLDANGDGAIGTRDFAVVRRAFGGAPGPSGLACAGVAPCPAP